MLLHSQRSTLQRNANSHKEGFTLSPLVPTPSFLERLSTMQQFLGIVTFTPELGPLAIPLMVSTEQEYQSCTEGPLNNFRGTKGTGLTRDCGACGAYWCRC